MRKHLADWAAIAEIVSGIAVAVTLVLLLMGIKENTETTRAAMYANAVSELNALGQTLLADPELSRIYGTYLDGRATELGEGDRYRLAQMINGIFRNYDIAFSMRKYQVFGENEWGRFENLICDHRRRAILANLENEPERISSPDFKEYMRVTCAE